ncbi:LLM class flavin-dependent oxidoreductase [Brachybacterium phenoliresistens]|uniref:LLM class flavin-dependent oxidoreductase n=1 Tax=Brachybacterium phenoliresistens TaxID=396014 RepID=UPI0031D1042E
MTPAPSRPLPPVLAVDLVTDPLLAPDLARRARALEAAGIGAIVLTDGGLHPIHAAAHLAPATSATALIPRADAVHVEPFHLATQLMSLDHVSGGRAGWLLTAATDPAVPAAVGREALDARAAAQEAADVLAVSRLLWDSWTDDAVVRDADSGIYVAAARLQYVDFEGATFSVRGPAITPRSPQGQIPVLVADADREVVGEAVAGRAADGRALDVDATGLDSEGIVAAVDAALRVAGAPTAQIVRLLGLVPDDRLAATLHDAGTALRGRGLVAPSPSAGQSLRDQLGLTRPKAVIDPARRADRARIARGESSLFADRIGPTDQSGPSGPTSPSGSSSPATSDDASILQETR